MGMEVRGEMGIRGDDYWRGGVLGRERKGEREREILSGPYGKRLGREEREEREREGERARAARCGALERRRSSRLRRLRLPFLLPNHIKTGRADLLVVVLLCMCSLRRCCLLSSAVNQYTGYTHTTLAAHSTQTAHSSPPTNHEADASQRSSPRPPWHVPWIGSEAASGPCSPGRG